MNNILINAGRKFRDSAKELSNPATLTVCAMMLAISLVLSYFGNISITFLGTNVIKLSFVIVPIAVAAMLYGPVGAGIIGGPSDIIGFRGSPMCAYIPGFTISMILIGFAFGLVLYEEKPTVPRIAAVQLFVSAVISTLLGSLWFVLFYGFKPLQALSVRGIKELVMYPINVLLIFVIARVIAQLPEIRQRKRSKEASEQVEPEAE